MNVHDRSIFLDLINGGPWWQWIISVQNCAKCAKMKTAETQKKQPKCGCANERPCWEMWLCSLASVGAFRGKFALGRVLLKGHRGRKSIFLAMFSSFWRHHFTQNTIKKCSNYGLVHATPSYVPTLRGVEQLVTVNVPVSIWKKFKDKPWRPLGLRG